MREFRAVDLYVCYGTWTVGAQLHRHPCGEAHKVLRAAGHRPGVIRTYGLGLAPGPVNEFTPGRRKVKQLTGNYWVPVLVLDDGSAIQGSDNIISWARANPAGSEVATAAAAAGE